MQSQAVMSRSGDEGGQETEALGALDPSPRGSNRLAKMGSFPSPAPGTPALLSTHLGRVTGACQGSMAADQNQPPPCDEKQHLP